MWKQLLSGKLTDPHFSDLRSTAIRTYVSHWQRKQEHRNKTAAQLEEQSHHREWANPNPQTVRC